MGFNINVRIVRQWGPRFGTPITKKKFSKKPKKNMLQIPKSTENVVWIGTGTIVTGL
jgi:hypothetical protein